MSKLYERVKALFIDAEITARTCLDAFLKRYHHNTFSPFEVKVNDFLKGLKGSRDHAKFAEVHLTYLINHLNSTPATALTTFDKGKLISEAKGIIDSIKPAEHSATPEKEGKRPPAASPGVAAGRKKRFVVVCPVAKILADRDRITANLFNNKKYIEASESFSELGKSLNSNLALTETERNKLQLILLDDEYESVSSLIKAQLNMRSLTTQETILKKKTDLSQKLEQLKKLKQSIDESERKSGDLPPCDNEELKGTYQETLRALACNRAGNSTEELTGCFARNQWQLANALLKKAKAGNDPSALNLIEECNLLNSYRIKHISSKKTEKDIAAFRTKVTDTRNKIALKLIDDLEKAADCEADDIEAALRYYQAFNAYIKLELVDVTGATSPLKKGLELANSIFMLYRGIEGPTRLRTICEVCVYYFLQLLPKLNTLTEEQLKREENKLTADDFMDFCVSMYKYIKETKVLQQTKEPTIDKDEETVEVSWSEKWGEQPYATALGEAPLDYLFNMIEKFMPACLDAGVNGEDIVAAEKILESQSLRVFGV